MNTGAWGGWQAFSDAARSYLDGFASASPPNAAQQFSDFLREQFERAPQPWGGAHAAPSAMPFPGALPEAPAFGATREHQQRAQRIAEAALRMDAAQRRLQRLWSDVLREAAAKFVSQLAPTPPHAATPEVLRKLYDTWIDCAEDAYARVAHGDAFSQAQADFANAASQWRLEQQANLEHWSKFLDLPMRSEINSLTRRLRAVEEQLRTRTQPTGRSSAKPRSASTSRAKAKKKRT
jgi:hypothetical protein